MAEAVTTRETKTTHGTETEGAKTEAGKHNGQTQQNIG